MYRSVFAAAAAVSLCAPPAMAQQLAPAAPSTTPASDTAIVATPAPVVAGTQASLPANTEILVRMNEDLTTKGGKIDVGTTFRMTVVDDIRLNNFIVIPKGTPAVGEVTWKTGKGAFGKSGKMEVEIRYLDFNGRRIPLSGKYRQEGEGNTVATVAAVVAVGVFGAFVTGKSALIPQGRELKAYTTEAVPVVIPVVVPAPVSAAPEAVKAAAAQ